MKPSDSDFIMKNIHDMMASPSCCDEAKEAGQAWLDAAGTDREAKATQKLMEDLAECVLPIDQMIEIASSAKGEELFGKERAQQLADHAREIKEQGQLYCDCQACTPAKAILERRLKFA